MRLVPIVMTAAVAVISRKDSTVVFEEVRRINIEELPDGDVGRFASSPLIAGTEGFRVFTGPRTIIQLLALKASTSGQPQYVPPPSINSRYTFSFPGPYIHCGDANSTASTITEGLLEERMDRLQGSTKELFISYYAFVPGYEYFPNGSYRIVALDRPRVQLPVNATNELWITYMKSQMAQDGNITSARRHFTVCKLHKANYTITLEYENGIQSVVENNLVVDPEPIPYPDSDPSKTDMVQHSYSAIMWAISDVLVGSMSLSQDMSTGVKLGFIDTRIAHTSLLGSNDLDHFFWYNKRNMNPSETNFRLKPQRLQDKGFARNETLDVLIPELSRNVTYSLAINPILTYETFPIPNLYLTNSP